MNSLNDPKQTLNISCSDLFALKFKHIFGCGDKPSLLMTPRHATKTISEVMNLQLQFITRDGGVTPAG